LVKPECFDENCSFLPVMVSEARTSREAEREGSRTIPRMSHWSCRVREFYRDSVILLP